MKQVLSLSFLTLVLCICTNTYAADTATKVLMQNSFMQVAASPMGNMILSPTMRQMAKCLAQQHEPRANPASSAMQRMLNGCKWVGSGVATVAPWVMWALKNKTGECVLGGLVLGSLGGLWAHQKCMSGQISDLSEAVVQQGEANKQAFVQAAEQRAAMITHLINTHALLKEVQGKTNNIDETTKELLAEFTQLQQEVATKTDLRQLELRVCGFQFAVYQQLKGQINTLTDQQRKHIEDWQEKYGRLHGLTQANAEAIAELRSLVEQVKDAQDKDRITNESTNAMVSTLLANQTAGQPIAASSSSHNGGNGPAHQVLMVSHDQPWVQEQYFSFARGNVLNNSSSPRLLTNGSDDH